MDEIDTDSKSTYALRTLLRGMQVLKEFTFEKPEWSPAELARHLGWGRANVHRILLTLREAGMLEADVRNGTYHLSVTLFELGGVMLNRLGLTAKAYPSMAWLTESTGLSCNLGILNGQDVVYIDKIEAGTHLQLSARPGRRLPAYRTALGRAILSELPDEAVDRILERATLRPTTPFTITSADRIREQLQSIRRRGFSVDMQENTVGIIGLGAAIMDDRDCAFAGISMGGPASMFDPARIETLGASIRSSALQISKACGAKNVNLP